MSSVIVLDSDSDDEGPKAKRQQLIPSTGQVTTIASKIIPLKTVAQPISLANSKSSTTNSICKASIQIPSGITVTRHSPVTYLTKHPAKNTAQSRQFHNGSKDAKSISVRLPNIIKTTPGLVQPALLQKSLAANTTLVSQTKRQIQDEEQNRIFKETMAVTTRKRRTPTPPTIVKSSSTTQQLSTIKRSTVTMPANSLAVKQIGQTTKTMIFQSSKASAVCSSAVKSSVNSTVGPTAQSGLMPISISSAPPLRLLASPPPVTNLLQPSTVIPTSRPAALKKPPLLHNRIQNSSSVANEKINFENKNINDPDVLAKHNYSSISTPMNSTAPQSSDKSNVLNSKSSLDSKHSMELTRNINSTTNTTIRRIKPTTLLDKTDAAWQRQISLSPLTPSGSTSQNKKPKTTSTTVASEIALNCNEPVVIYVGETKRNGSSSTKIAVKNLKPSSSEVRKTTPERQLCEKSEERIPFDKDFAELLKMCRKAENSTDMEKLIENKLNKYYYSVHSSFVRSRGFRKTVRSVIDSIRDEPDLVYLHLKTVIDELKIRRKGRTILDEETIASGSKNTNITEDAPSAEEILSSVKDNDITTQLTGNKRTDEQIRKLNRALHIVTKRIEVLETAEVDWNDDDSSYLQVERYKKRACQLYEKICDLTGENKTALRLVRKPINFNETAYPRFNKTLQAFVNRTREFPDYFDVLHMLEHCNKQYGLGLAIFEMKRIAHDAFTKVGKLLQARRKTDLYETVTHFTANSKDPASDDPELAAKLIENKKHEKKIGEIIEKYAREQDLTAEEQREARLKERQQGENSSVESSLDSPTTYIKEQMTKVRNEVSQLSDDDESDEDYEHLDELDDVQLDNLANGHLSEADSETETDTLDINTEARVSENVINSKIKIPTPPKSPLTTTFVKGCDTQTLEEELLDQSVETEIPLKSPVVTSKERDKSDVFVLEDVIKQSICQNYCKVKTINNNTMRDKTVSLDTTKIKVSTSTASSIKTQTSNELLPCTTINANGKHKTSVNTSPLIKQIPATLQMLKIMSVSSLNASLATEAEEELLKQRKTVMEKPAQHKSVALALNASNFQTEIIISDEES